MTTTFNSPPMPPERAQLIERLRFVLSLDGPDTVILTKDTVAAAAAALDAEHEARVAAETAQTLVIEQAAEVALSYAKSSIKAFASQRESTQEQAFVVEGKAAAGYDIAEAIRALASDAGVKALAALRAERDAQVASAQTDPTEPGGYNGDIFYGDPVKSTMGTHRWENGQWVKLPSELEATLDLLAAARAERDTLAAQVEALTSANADLWKRIAQLEARDGVIIVKEQKHE